MIVSIREFVRKFFLCEECVKHFTNMTSNVENEINSFKENVLYLWRGNSSIIPCCNHSKMIEIFRS